MSLTVERLTPIGSLSTWGRPMPRWYWEIRNTRQAEHHLGWAAPPIAYGECPYYRQTGDRTCNLGCWEEPECQTCHPAQGWPRRPLNLRRPHHRSTLRSLHR